MCIHFRAFGLILSADRPIPGMAPTEPGTEVDVRISLEDWPNVASCVVRERVDALTWDEVAEPLLQVWTMQSGDYWWFRYIDRTEFAIDRVGSRIWARWPPSSTLEDTATYLLGPIITAILQLRGITCLHASAVAIAGRAVILVGAAGAGKSTTAAAFAKLGYAVLSDDVVSLKEAANGAIEVEPAYPRIRLWPSSVEALFGSANALPALTPTWDKRYLTLDGKRYRFQTDALPLGAIYLLDRRCWDSTAPSLHRVSPREALIALVANTHGGQRLSRSLPDKDFKRLARLASKIQVRRVVSHRDPTRLERLCDLIREDAERAFGHDEPR